MATQEELFQRSLLCIPGGVHSPVRSFQNLQISPRFIRSGEKAFITDTDGKEYIDFCMSFGPLLLGHADPQINTALKKALERGLTFGTCEPYSLDLAEFLIKNLGNPVEQIRFVNSGTEAVMTALRLARGFTKKDKVIKFKHCYHGHTDSMLVDISQGITEHTRMDTLVLELGDRPQLKKVFQTYKKQIAAVIIEPLPCNHGLIINDKIFLEYLREITLEEEALLIFDEVITGFRVSFGGMVERLKIIPDLITYGKIIGGGLPVAAVAGPRKIMEYLAPTGSVYQAGTLSANPLAMIAGLTALRQIQKIDYRVLEERTLSLSKIFKNWFRSFNKGEFSRFNIHTFESLFSITTLEIDQYFPSLFKTLLRRGIYLSPQAYEVGFMSMAHDETVLVELEKRLWI